MTSDISPLSLAIQMQRLLVQTGWVESYAGSVHCSSMGFIFSLPATS
jgi:hypothetical protein